MIGIFRFISCCGATLLGTAEQLSSEEQENQSRSRVGGIFLSRTNYSCRPNEQHTWNSSTKHEAAQPTPQQEMKRKMTIIRDIKKGEEKELRLRLQDSNPFLLCIGAASGELSTNCRSPKTSSVP